MRTIPLKAGSNGRELSEIRSIFVQGVSEHCQLTARIDGIDGGFLFGNARLGVLALGLIHFPFLLGTVPVHGGLTPVQTNCSIVYLGCEITPGLFGEGLVTLTPGVVGWKTPRPCCYI